MRLCGSLAGLDVPFADKVLPVRGNVGIGRGAALQFEPNRLDLWDGTGPFAGVFESPTSAAGTAGIIYTKGVQLGRAGDLYLAELRASALALASGCTASACPIALLHATTAGGWLRVYSGVGIGQLRQFTIVVDNIAYLTKPWTVNPVASSTVQLIRPVFGRTPVHGSGIVAGLSTAVAASPHPIIIEQYIQRGYGEMEELRPGAHDALDGLNLVIGGIKFFYKLTF